MVGSPRRRLTVLSALLLTLAGLSAVTAPPAAATESYSVSYPTPARYLVDTARELTVGVQFGLVLDLDPAAYVRTVAVRATFPDGSWTDRKVTLTPLSPSVTMPIPTERRTAIDYSVTFRDSAGSVLDRRTFGVAVVGRASRLHARWPGKYRVRERGSYVVRGTLAGGARRVVVQRKAPGAWITLGAGRSDASGSYAIPMATAWVTRHRRLRVRAPETRTHNAAAVLKSRGLVVTRAYRPRPGRVWRPITAPGASGQRWTPCQAPGGLLTYRVNPNRAPRGYLTEVRKAFAQVTAATGFRFRYAGPTSLVPLAKGTRAITRDADITIAYATARQVPVLRGGVIGVAPVKAQSTNTSWWRIIEAAVVLDSQARLAPGFAAGKITRGSVLIHEIGHTMGLDHVDDRRQIMYPAITRNAARFARGDLRGLEKVGVARGCFSGERDPFGRTGSERRLPGGPTHTVVHTVDRER